MTEKNRNNQPSKQPHKCLEKEVSSPYEVIKEKLIELYNDNDIAWTKEFMDPFSNTFLAKTFNENADSFFNEIIQITENNREKEAEKVRLFLERINEIFLGRSPDISNRLSIVDMLIVSAKVNRVEEMRGFVGQNIVGEFVYEISYADENIIKTITDKIENLPYGIREDVINQLETCFANAVGNGEWAETGTARIREIIDYFKNSSSPLTRIVAEVAEKSMLIEKEDPSVGVITTMDNKHAGRLNSYTEIISIHDKVNNNLPKGYRASVVAKDAIVGLDHSGMARFGAMEEKAKDLINLPDAGINIIKYLSNLENKQFENIDLRGLLYWLGKFSNKFESEKTIYKFYGDLLDFPEEKMKEIINGGSDTTPFFQQKWDVVRKKINLMIQTASTKFKNIKHINFESFNEIIQNEKLAPFGFIDKNDSILLTQCLRPEVREKIEGSLGVSFTNISFRAEIALLRFLSAENNEIYIRLCTMLKKFTKEKTVVIETFVDCAKNIELGEKIILLCENADAGIVNKIFSKYLELIEQLNNVENVLNEAYHKETYGEEVYKIKEALLKKGKDLLAHFADQITKKETVSTEEVLDYLQNIETEATTFFLAFKTLKEENQLPPIEEIKGLSWEVVVGGNVPDEDLVKMESIYKNNYLNNEELLEDLVKKFKERVSDKNTKFYILKHEGKIKGFIGFTKEGEGLYMHSVNIDLPLRGISIGDTLITKAINQEGENQVIKADCSAVAPIGAKYIEDGFVCTKFYSYKNAPSLEIIKNPKEKFETKQIQKESFVKEYLEFELSGKKGMFDNGKYVIQKAPTQEKIDMEYINKGNVLTRYFSYQSGDKKEWYAVFEKTEK